MNSTQNGMTALAVASAHEHAECVVELIRAGADVNFQTDTSKISFKDLLTDLANAGTILLTLGPSSMALMSAVKQGHVHCVRELIRAGANVDATNQVGTTAVMISCIAQSIDCLRELIKARASVNYVSCTGVSALKMAAISGQ